MAAEARKGKKPRRKAAQKVTFVIKNDKHVLYKKISAIIQKPECDWTQDDERLLRKHSKVRRQAQDRIANRQKIKNRSREFEDERELLESKCEILAEAIKNSKHLLVYTGAGISTSAKIPDYRGANGIWTLLQQGKDIGRHDLSQAEPTATHMALYDLYERGTLKHVVSQNCDGLHLRSGLPRTALSEVHGDMYLEVCVKCEPYRHYLRLFDVTERTARYNHQTQRLCYACGHPLQDTIVHFGERGKMQWPLNWNKAWHQAQRADMILCLGSSLKVLKKYPWLWCMDKRLSQRPKLFIVNLQWTPKDMNATMKINGKCDEIMKLVMSRLGYPIPAYTRDADPLFHHITSLHPLEEHTTTQPHVQRVATVTTTEDAKSDDMEISDDDMSAICTVDVQYEYVESITTQDEDALCEVNNIQECSSSSSGVFSPSNMLKAGDVIRISRSPSNEDDDIQFEISESSTCFVNIRFDEDFEEVVHSNIPCLIVSGKSWEHKAVQVDDSMFDDLVVEEEVLDIPQYVHYVEDVPCNEEPRSNVIADGVGAEEFANKLIGDSSCNGEVFNNVIGDSECNGRLVNNVEADDGFNRRDVNEVIANGGFNGRLVNDVKADSGSNGRLVNDAILCGGCNGRPVNDVKTDCRSNGRLVDDSLSGGVCNGILVNGAIADGGSNGTLVNDAIACGGCNVTLVNDVKTDGGCNGRLVNDVKVDGGCNEGLVKIVIAGGGCNEGHSNNISAAANNLVYYRLEDNGESVQNSCNGLVYYYLKNNEINAQDRNAVQNCNIAQNSNMAQCNKIVYNSNLQDSNPGAHYHLQSNGSMSLCRNERGCVKNLNKKQDICEGKIACNEQIISEDQNVSEGNKTHSGRNRCECKNISEEIMCEGQNIRKHINDCEGQKTSDGQIICERRKTLEKTKKREEQQTIENIKEFTKNEMERKIGDICYVNLERTGNICKPRDPSSRISFHICDPKCATKGESFNVCVEIKKHSPRNDPSNLVNEKIKSRNGLKENMLYRIAEDNDLSASREKLKNIKIESEIKKEVLNDEVREKEVLEVKLLGIENEIEVEEVIKVEKVVKTESKKEVASKRPRRAATRLYSQMSRLWNMDYLTGLEVDFDDSSPSRSDSISSLDEDDINLADRLSVRRRKLSAEGGSSDEGEPPSEVDGEESEDEHEGEGGLKTGPCDYCAQRYKSEECLFYISYDARVSKERPCLCCNDGKEDRENNETEPDKVIVNAGWFGKGFRKARRKCSFRRS